jgi:hypothetical protein
MLASLRRTVVLAGTSLLLLCGAVTAPAGASDADRIARGFAIVPVPLNLNGLDRQKVGLGSYFVNSAGGCGDCHSEQVYRKGGDPYLGQTKHIRIAGYLAGGRAFGPFVSANLTPDRNRRPGGMTLTQFLAAMQHGRDPDNPNRILQVMPWPMYADLLRSDLVAIYEYLKAIPSLRH